jgi:hypothetical protein
MKSQEITCNQQKTGTQKLSKKISSLSLVYLQDIKANAQAPTGYQKG